MTLIVGTRGSALALAQAHLVARALGPDALLRTIRTHGDVTERPLAELGDGAFVTALEDALRRGEIDAAVHSLKDLPTEERADLAIAAVPPRADPRDVLITRARGGLPTLPPGAVVGSSSPRRSAFIRALRADIEVRPIRGNVDTRLRKVASGEYDATVVALAGLRRLGIEVRDDEILPLADWPPAPGQGALAVQCRAADAATRERVAALDDAGTRAAVTAERALLRLLGASCALALGAIATARAGRIELRAALAADGRVRRATARAGDAHDAARIAFGALSAEPIGV